MSVRAGGTTSDGSTTTSHRGPAAQYARTVADDDSELTVAEATATSRRLAGYLIA